MTALRGTYFQGKISLEQPFETDQPVDVIVTFLQEEAKPLERPPLRFSDFSFARTRELLKDLQGSLSDGVIAERRSAL